MAGFPPPATGSSPYTYGPAELAYIQERARTFGLDPKAVTAVAKTEGISLPSQVGDNGTSFGPWQLHSGGQLPAEVWAKGPAYAQAWANSPDGIDYALAGIAKVARNQQGAPAIQTIVSKFERPAGTNPDGSIQPGSIAAKEIARAVSYYSTSSVPTTGGSSITSDVGGAAGAVGGAVSGAVGDVLHPFQAIGDVFTFLTSWRFAEVLGGFALLIVGLMLLGKQFGISPPAVVPVPV